MNSEDMHDQTRRSIRKLACMFIIQVSNTRQQREENALRLVRKQFNSPNTNNIGKHGYWAL